MMKGIDELITIVIASSIVALIAAFVIFPLPPSPTFFDSLGRYTAICGIGVILWAAVSKLLNPSKPVSIGEALGAGALSAFFGTIGGVLLEGVINLIRS